MLIRFWLVGWELLCLFSGAMLAMRVSPYLCCPLLCVVYVDSSDVAHVLDDHNFYDLQIFFVIHE